MADVTPYVRPTAQVEPYVEALGQDMAVTFLLEFGGAEIYLATSPKSRSRVAKLVGWDKAVALAQLSERLQRRVPLANKWIAASLKARGLSVADIARRMRASDVAVRKWISEHEAPDQRKPDPDQPELPLF